GRQAMKTNTSRRHFLRGAGVALALPWMESLPLFGAQDDLTKGSSAAEVAALNKPPTRFACMFFSNGIKPANWWAKGSGAQMEFGPSAQPLTDIREDLVFVRGLYHQKALSSTSPHLARMNLLSGAPVSLHPNDIRVGTSMDQVM